MKKHNSFTKKLNKQFLSINDSIESYFNKLKTLKSDIKKFNLSRNNRVFLIIGTIVILTLSYFLAPTIYNIDIVEKEIKNQVLKKYNIELKFNESIRYGLFPKPHFFSKNSSIIRNKKSIASSPNLKIFIGVDKFLLINKVDVKDLVFTKTDFNIYKGDLLFFRDLLKTEPNENKIIIKKSNIFFKNKNDEVLFINKISNSSFFYDSNNLENIFLSKNEIFNIPFKVKIKNDKFNKLIISNLNFKKIRLDLKNTINYSEKIKKGLLEILLINKNTKLNYEVNDNSINFVSEGTKNNYNGLIEFKPFYFTANFNYDGLSSKNLFKDDSIFLDLIRSDIFYNKNLNANINLNVKNITNDDELNDLYLKIGIQEGDISFSNSNIMWKDDLKITLNESFITFDNNEFNVIGKLIIDFKNLDSFYRSFQIKKIYRKEIKQIEIDFVYNFSQQIMNFENVIIDKKNHLKLEKYVDDFNQIEDRVFNKITFKNFVNNFFKTYAG